MTAEFANSFDDSRPLVRAYDVYSHRFRELGGVINQIDFATKSLTASVKRGESIDDEYVKLHKELAQEVMDRARRRGDNSWVDIYRLAMAADFMEERALAPVLFSDNGAYEERKKLTNGLAGVAVQRLGEAINDYDQAETQGDLDQLFGISQELTDLSLLNNKQVPSMLAVPSKRIADRRRRTDLNLYHMVKRQGHVANIQVKSTTPRIGAVRVKPRNGFVISGDEIGNTRLYPYDGKILSVAQRQESDMPVSRALVKLHEGEPLDLFESALLDKAQDQLDQIVEERRRETPGYKLKMKND